ncbi:hypothetical protein GQ53DRAFT_745338, partial [Thozetella sp. PMI_491]
MIPCIRTHLNQPADFGGNDASILDLSTVAHVEEVAIHPEQRAKGLGFKLIKVLGSMATAVGATSPIWGL